MTRPCSEKRRAALRDALNDPLVLAVLSRKAAQSWANPEVRARRIAGLKAARRRRAEGEAHNE
jgi:hypothetical protein